MGKGDHLRKEALSDAQHNALPQARESDVLPVQQHGIRHIYDEKDADPFVDKMEIA
jgi:hypothetical protein